MKGNNLKSADKAKEIIYLIASIIIGLTFLMSGTGKLFGPEATAAQILDFIGYIIPDVLITPATMDFLTGIFFPRIFPWAELILGISLLVGFMPRFIAVICIPLIVAFMGTNIYSLTKGGYTTCASCFGMWDKIFGSLTPTQSLIYDIVLLVLAISIILFFRGSFFSSRKWLGKFVEERKPGTEKPEVRVFPCGNSVRNLNNKVCQHIREFGKRIKNRKRFVVETVICLIGIVLIICGVFIFQPNSGRTLEETKKDSVSIIVVVVSNITESSVTISWVTPTPGTSEVEYWLSNTSIRNTMSKGILTKDHSIDLNGLSKDASYFFVVKSIDSNGNKAISEQRTFILAMTPVVGKPAPDFTLNSLDGKAINLSNYRGKMVMLDFWVWSCSGCREKMAIIQEVFARIPSEKIVILCINVKERELIIRNYATSEKITVPILLDLDGQVSARYKINGFPSTVFIDADGIIRLKDAEFSNAIELENILNSINTTPATVGK